MEFAATQNAWLKIMFNENQNIVMFDKFLAMCFNGMYPICCVGFFGLTSSSPAHRVLDGIFRNGKVLVHRVKKCFFLWFLEVKGQVSILVKKVSARASIGLKNAAEKSALFLGSWRGQTFWILNSAKKKFSVQHSSWSRQ